VRLGSSAQHWHVRREKLNGDRLPSRFLATARATSRESAERLGVLHLVNLASCLAR
jgi:hypothetical protein